MSRFVLDASALMVFFEDRPGAAKVSALLKNAADKRHTLLMSVINWGEVYYSVWRTRGPATANEIIGQIAQLPIEIVDVDLDTARRAAVFKAENKLPYVDAFAAALAQSQKASLVTADADFKLVQAKLIIRWIVERENR